MLYVKRFANIHKKEFVHKHEYITQGKFMIRGKICHLLCSILSSNILHDVYRIIFCSWIWTMTSTISLLRYQAACLEIAMKFFIHKISKQEEFCVMKTF